jgi:hypothetical protein
MQNHSHNARLRQTSNKGERRRMPIRYTISPELNLVIYICRGEIKAADLFLASDLVLLDPLRKPGMRAIYDLFFAAENIELKDLHDAIARLENAAEIGPAIGPRVILSRSSGIHILVEAMKLLPSRVPIQIDAFHTIEDAIKALGLVDKQQAIIQFWQECNSRFEGSS